MSGYGNFVEQITILAEASTADVDYSLANAPDFENLIPAFIAYAEGRIYRDCVFLATRTQNYSLKMTAGSRTLAFAAITPTLINPEGFALITPVTATNPQNGTRNAFDEAALDVIDNIWPQESVTMNPSALQPGQGKWAMKDNQTIVVAPTPDDIYTAEITGLFQPAPLSATNTDTYVTNVYPDLMLAAGMISVSGFLRDYGAQSEDPKTGNSWETQYQVLLKGVAPEEQRRRGEGTGWSQNTATPMATPARN